jgi:DNA polymerase III sliding clamp (beta) subunit (PCNA family)
MKFRISRPVLADGLKRVAMSVGSDKSTMAVLAMVKMKAEGDVLELTTTNLSVTTVCRVPIQGDEDGAVATDFRKLRGLLATRKEPFVEFSSKLPVLSIVSGGRFKVPAIDIDEFPSLIRQGDELISFDLESPDKFVSFVTQVLGVVDIKNFSRPTLCSVALILKSGILSIVATDGFRLVIHKMSVPGVEDFEAILDAAFCKIIRNAPQAECTVSVSKSGHVSIVSDEIEFYGSTVAGLYPDYQRFIPVVDLEHTAVVDGQQLSEAVTTCLSMANSFVFDSPFLRLASRLLKLLKTTIVQLKWRLTQRFPLVQLVARLA